MNDSHHTPSDQPANGPLDPAERLTLCPADAAVLDYLLDHATYPNDTQRQQRVQAWLTVLGHAPTIAAPSDLVANTLSAVEDEFAPLWMDAQAQAIGGIGGGIGENTNGGGLATTPVRNFPFGRYMVELAAMAVAASVVVAVLIPGLAAARQDAQRVTCSANLGTLGTAFANYATLNHDALPSLGKSPDGNWQQHDPLASTGHSNTANLLPLLRQGFADSQRLACPARGTVSVSFDPSRNDIPDGIRGYSYINLFGPERTWDHQSTTVVLADRNPLFEPDTSRDPMANSFNHGRRGTNILTAAQNIDWVKTPNVGPRGSNIWTIDNGKTIHYTGVEMVSNPEMLFLSP
ncbi:MAG: hypothetical protein WCI73_09710 [Phycisphaerae bacterium]